MALYTEHFAKLLVRMWPEQVNCTILEDHHLFSGLTMQYETLSASKHANENPWIPIALQEKMAQLVTSPKIVIA